jgi:large subunit ribosomal protein L6
MSRIGKRAIAVPSGVTANVEGQTVKIKGPKGALQVALHDDVAVKLDSGQIKIEPRAETKRARAQWGTSRTLVANLISGVTKGFEQRLEISGVGYRASVQGKNLQIALGRHRDCHTAAGRNRHFRYRQAESRPGCRRNSRVPATRTV